MEKEQTTTAVSVAGQFDESKVPQMIATVTEKINAIKGGEEAPVRINKALGPFGIIGSIKDPRTLIGAYSYITSKAEANEKHHSLFQKLVPTVKIESFKEQSHSLEQWQKEITLQYTLVTNEQQLAQLQELKANLEELLSEQDKKAAKIKAVADRLESLAAIANS